MKKLYNLPTYGNCKYGVYGFYIHSGTSCTGDNEDEFKDALKHYNPNGCINPNHAGDMPPLFENNGYAYISFFTNRFKVEEII